MFFFFFQKKKKAYQAYHREARARAERRRRGSSAISAFFFLISGTLFFSNLATAPIPRDTPRLVPHPGACQLAVQTNTIEVYDLTFVIRDNVRHLIEGDPHFRKKAWLPIEPMTFSPCTYTAMQSNTKRQDVSQSLQQILNHLRVPLPPCTEDVAPTGGKLLLELANFKRLWVGARRRVALDKRGTVSAVLDVLFRLGSRRCCH